MPQHSKHIQITDTPPRVQYVADGVQTEFPFPFQIIKTTDLEVYLGEQKQASNYLVSGEGDTNGGAIVLSEAPGDGTTVTLVRNTPIERTSDFQQSGVFQAKVLNDELDLLTAALQDVAENVRRSIKLAVVDSDADLDLAKRAERANGVLAFDADGNVSVIASSGTADGDVTPGGGDGQVQFNDGGVFEGDGGLIYTKSTHTLSVDGSVQSDTIFERTAGAGVTVDGVLIRDGMIDGRDVSSDGATLDGIAATAVGLSDVTFENLEANADIGGGAGQVARGDHRHDAEYATVHHDHDERYAVSGHGHDAMFAAITHAHAHAANGDDPLKLDELVEPDDTSELDASTSRHGLLPKLSGNANEYLDGVGNWSTPAGGGGGDAISIDEGNFSLSFFDGVAAHLEAGTTGAFCTQGTPSFPNRVGDGSNTIVGSGYDGVHVAGALWRAADGAYVAGSADYAGIIGGYDCLNNQIGGWISGSNHSVLMYNVQGHGYIGGGSYNLIEGGRCAVLGSTACAITGNSGYSAIVAGRNSLINDNHYSLVVGQNNTLDAGSGCLVVGQGLTVGADHVNALIVGRDVTSHGADTVTRGSGKLVIENDVRVWSKIFKARTTDAALTNMNVNPPTFEAGKVYAGWVKVKVVGLHDDGANGNGGGVFNHVVLAGETGFMWDEDSNHGNFNGAANTSSPTFNLTVAGTDKIGVGTCQLAMNTGMLRVKVAGKASTTINWVAEMEVVSTAAAS